MKAVRIIVVLFVCLGLQQVAKAEFRPWTDTKGNAVEAEYIRTVEEMVVLRKRDGIEIKVPLVSLCEEDRKYAMLQCPPRIEIKVDDKVERETVGYTGGARGAGEVRVESVKTGISLKKTSVEPYESDLTLEVVLIGRMEQLNRYVMVERSKSVFQFTNENKGLYTYTSGPVDLRNVTGNRKAGSRYEGYLVIVRDERDEIIATKASRIEFEKNAKAILEGPKGSIFDEDFTLIRKGNAPRRVKGT